MFFDSLERLPADSILGLMTAFREDPSPEKVDLSVGVYREASGETPVMRAVKRAEAELIAEQTSKAYVAPIGVAGFRSGMIDLVFGAGGERLRSRIACLQTPGGCGALRVAAGIYKRAVPDGEAYVSEPTWSNHYGLLGGGRVHINQYPYYQPETHLICIDQMLACLQEVPSRSLIVLQVGCHNPTGADPEPSDWEAILNVIEERSLLPLFDLAYQGMGTSLEADAEPLRAAAARLPELMVAVSASKNFGLYRERTGALLVLTRNPTEVEVIESQMKDITRGMYSMAPSHGPMIVERILGNTELYAEWREELEAMRLRIVHFRQRLKDSLQAFRPELDLEWLVKQRGMFSLLGISRADVEQLRHERHIYMVGDSRINIAGLNDQNLEVVAAAIAPLL